MKTRLIYLLLIFFSLQFTLLAQTDRKITLDFQNEELPAALKKLEQASGYRILFTYDDIQKYTVNLSIKNETITQAINVLLQDKPLNYTLKGNQYVVVVSASVKSVNSLKGQIQDEQSTPMENATIMLKKGEKVITGSITDANGNYFIPNIPTGDYKLCVSFLGYETYTRPLTIVSDMVIPEPIILKDTSVGMGEVVITASVPTFKMKGGNVVANVANSVLNRETKVMDVLRKIPGMTMEDGQLTSFTGGIPIIYINGKKTRSIDEVKQLEVKNIKDVELITNPGAEYDASVGAVLLITTIRRTEGWSVQLEGELSQNHRLSNEEGVKLNYQTGNLNLFGTFTYGDFRRKSHQLMKTVITAPDTVWTQDLDQQCKAMIYTSYNYSAGADYSINDRHSIGIQYDGNVTTDYNDAPSYARILANDKPYDYIKGNSILKNNNDYYHHLNAYYTGKWNEKIKLDIYTDYARIHNGRVQTVTEESERSGLSEITNRNKADYNVGYLMIKQKSSEMGVSKKEKRGLVITEIFMILLAAVWFIPIYYLIVTTFKNPQEATQSPLGLPKVWVFQNYVDAFVNMQYPRALFNTVKITVLAVAIIVLVTSMAGYALARTKSRWGNRIFLLFLAGLVVPFQMNIVSLFKIVKSIGLMNTAWAVILVDVAINVPQGIFLFKEFVESTIPKELEEAAEIDGCSVIRKFFVIVLPLLKPVIATVVILVTLNVWNEFMTPLLFLQSREQDVILQEVSRNIGQFSTDWTALFPMLMLGVAPLMIFYIFMQKYIIAGVSAGAVKG